MPESNPEESSRPGATLEDILKAIRALQPTRHPFRHTIAWVLAVCATAIIANIAVPGAHQGFTTADCYTKYFLQPHTAYPHSSEWKSFGVTSVDAISPATTKITPSVDSDVWFGATMSFNRYCDYRLSFSAELNGPLYPNEVRYIGYGYGIGVRGTTVNGVPNAVTTQYDPPFGGLRIVPIPCCANQAGYNAVGFPGVVAGENHSWLLTVIGSKAYVSFDGKGFGTMTVGHYDEILIRVWNASVTIGNVKITAIRPSP
jgi:hypothetical protein